MSIDGDQGVDENKLKDLTDRDKYRFFCMNTAEPSTRWTSIRWPQFSPTTASSNMGRKPREKPWEGRHP